MSLSLVWQNVHPTAVTVVNLPFYEKKSCKSNTTKFRHSTAY